MAHYADPPTGGATLPIVMPVLPLIYINCHYPLKDLTSSLAISHTGNTHSSWCNRLLAGPLLGAGDWHGALLPPSRALPVCMDVFVS